MNAQASVCLQLAVVATAVKLLLVPTYRSTDFEVHRNWLAITHSLPISKWYVEATSEWTLDYPPLFAWFEWLLSQLARWVDPAMLQVANLQYASGGTVLFQRLSVIVTDLVLLAAAYALARGELTASRAEDTPPVGQQTAGGGPAKAPPPPPQQQQLGSAPSPARAPTPLPTASIASNGGVESSGADGAAGGAAGSSSGPAEGDGRRGVVLFLLVVCNAGLLLVDHVHFQYNGVMMGVLLWSLHAARCGRHLASGLLFAALLNLKHLFLYAGPAFFVYLLRHYCCEGSALGPAISATSAANGVGGSDPRVGRRFGPRPGPGPGLGLGRVVFRLAVLGSGVVAIFAVSFGPFIAMGQMPQVLRRLFPFGRGLLHAYWAANAWAPYAAADKLLALGLPALGPRLLGPGVLAWLGPRIERIERGRANLAGGLVGVSSFSVLPQVTPAATAAAVLLALLPCLATMWVGDGRPGYVRRNIARAVSYSFLCGFVFGYHVHEKAVLVALLPLALDAVHSPTAARRFLLLSTAGHYGLLPLLFRREEYGTKMLLVLSYFVVSVVALGALHSGGGSGGGDSDAGKRRRRRRQVKSKRFAVLGPAAVLYLAGFLLIELYVSVVHDAVPVLRRRLPFAPLMLTSVYCSLGVLAVWGDMAAEWAREAVAGW
ncbi:hypothetical protein PLESTB_001428000 [Pleodorina starrii]|uniref:Alpha-1,3-glucosyltransferase n=1 Tax=Pleodorina starrii TaxID=330485 RepID=A0A9W6BVR8_9CHLO|nr:hypothetical protein PLESTM_001387500 [Pleodorina starrii]GLC58968.1 hypothetical protein PLESTB_001428000 [Pleodorina starrii]GLC67677.1 hypothetical protein PLESTF_000589800 [Pleodorina starrii]